MNFRMEENDPDMCFKFGADNLAMKTDWKQVAFCQFVSMQVLVFLNFRSLHLDSLDDSGQEVDGFLDVERIGINRVIGREIAERSNFAGVRACRLSG